MSHGFETSNDVSVLNFDFALAKSNPCDNNYSDTVSSDSLDFLFDETNKPT